MKLKQNKKAIERKENRKERKRDMLSFKTTIYIYLALR